MRSYLLPLPAALLAGCSLSQPGFTPNNPEPVFFADEIEITDGGQCFGVASAALAPMVTPAPAAIQTPDVTATAISADGAEMPTLAEAPATPELAIPRRDPEIEALIATTQGGALPDAPAPVASVTPATTNVATATPAPTPLQTAAADPDAEIDLLIAATEGGSLIAEMPETVATSPEMLSQSDLTLPGITDGDVLYFGTRDAEAPQETGERFETLCPPVYSADFVANLQRALQARDAYEGPISGLVDEQTRDAIQAFQASTGAPNSPLIAVSTARELGLVPLSDEELAALNAGEDQ